MQRLLLLLGRAVRLRCPRCGGMALFQSWLRPKHACPSCGQLIERTEEGFFLGALLVNLVIAEVLPLVTIVVVVTCTWPHSPWNLIMYGGAALAALSPFVFYPFSKLIWLAVDLYIQPSVD